jgi:hypothetical protein
MAVVLNTNDPQLPILYNVSSSVGPGQTNGSDDVWLVQFLLALVIPVATSFRVQTPAPPINGTFDLTTGFWIYEAQFDLKRKHPAQIIDGIVSPAGAGLVYTTGTPWVIAVLNFTVMTKFPDVFNNLPNDPRLSPSLQAALQD